jgi:hypothetical protein
MPTAEPTALAPTSAPAVAPLTGPPVAPSLLPRLTLNPGDRYFRIDGTPSFVFAHNVAGYQPVDLQTLLDWTKAGGSKFVRVQLDSFGMGYTRKGEVDPSWVAQWDQVFDRAEARGIFVLPVFAVWYEWNDGTGYSTWKSNPLNQANGGPAPTPAALFEKDSDTQILWLDWMRALIQRWQGRDNILGWEIFSEVNMAPESTQTAGVDFVNRAVAVVRSADPTHRPVTASLAETGTWSDFYANTSIDFINVHPYLPSGQLDRNIIELVQHALDKYDRPVLIGESGLSADTPDTAAGKLTVAPNAHLGIQHAIWAGVVSGAMNGRALWWEDGYGIYFPQLGMSWLQKYATEELPAARFVAGLDFSGFKPVVSATSRGTWGAAIGNGTFVIGWFRDAACEPPAWNLQRLVTNQTVTLSVPGSAADWKIDFYNTKTGTDIVGSALATRHGSVLTIPLPPFTDDIAFKMYPQP